MTRSGTKRTFHNDHISFFIYDIYDAGLMIPKNALLIRLRKVSPSNEILKSQTEHIDR